MDPITITAGSLTISKLAGTLIVSLPDVWRTYSTAQSQLDDLVSLLHSLKIDTTALSETLPLELNSGALADDDELSQSDRDLKSAVRINLNGCATLLKDLSGQIDLVTGLNNKLTKWRKAKYVWKKSDLDQLEGRLDRRVNALNLILNILSNPSRRVEVFSSNNRDTRELKNAADEVSLYSKSDDLAVVTRTFSTRNVPTPASRTRKDREPIPVDGQPSDTGPKSRSRLSRVPWAQTVNVQPSRKSPTRAGQATQKTTSGHTSTGLISKDLTVEEHPTTDPKTDRWPDAKDSRSPLSTNNRNRYDERSHYESEEEHSIALVPELLNPQKNHSPVPSTEKPSYYVCVAPPRDDRTDCFWIDSAGYVQHAKGSPRRFDHTYQITQLGPQTFPRDGYVTACNVSDDTICIFAVDHDGIVYGKQLTIRGDQHDLWTEWHRIGNLTATPGAYVCALGGQRNNLVGLEYIMAFVCNGSQVLYIFYHFDTLWEYSWEPSWAPIRHDAIKVVDGSPIAVIGNAFGGLEIFVVDINGVVKSTSQKDSEIGMGWHPWIPISPEVKSIPGGAITAMRRNPNTTLQRGARDDIYMIDKNNVVRHAEKNETGEWGKWDKVVKSGKGGPFPSGGWVSAIEHNSCAVVAAISTNGRIFMTSGLEHPGAWGWEWYSVTGSAQHYLVGYPGAFVGFSRREGHLEFNCILEGKNQVHKAQQILDYRLSRCDDGWRNIKGPAA